MINLNQLLSVMDSDQSQPKSGNDMAGEGCAIYDQEKGGFFDRKPENQPILAKNGEKKQLQSKNQAIS